MAKAALLLTVTTLSHLALGTMALMAAGIFAIAGLRDVRRRITRLVLLAAVHRRGLVLQSHSHLSRLRVLQRERARADVEVRLVRSRGHSPLARARSTLRLPSLPIVTILAGAGFVWMVLRARRDEASRAVLLAFLFFLLLFFGRPTWGSLLRILPLGEGFHYSRVLVLVHLFGIVMAGIALGAAIDACAGLRRMPAAPQPSWRSPAPWL
jgi:hypothetical protein